MIEFFEDAYLLAGHAYRLTIQPRDFDILHRVRYRYDQLLIPGDFVDNRTRDILTLPPLFPHAETVQRAPLVHSRNTRSQTIRIDEDVGEQGASTESQELTTEPDDLPQYLASDLEPQTQQQ